MASPQAPWKEISMEFIVELPVGGILLFGFVTNLFLKQIHFVPCPKISSANMLAKHFVQHVYRLHGAPECIISDRVQFISQF